jgi:hypothetical protein
MEYRKLQSPLIPTMSQGNVVGISVSNSHNARLKASDGTMLPKSGGRVDKTSDLAAIVSTQLGRPKM